MFTFVSVHKLLAILDTVFRQKWLLICVTISRFSATDTVFRQKGVDDRVEAAVDVREAGGADLESYHFDAVVDVDAGVRLDEERDVGRQPADGERHDDGRDHPHHAASRRRRLDRRAEDLPGVRADATAAPDASNQQDIQNADDSQRHGVTDEEERRVVDSAIALIQRNRRIYYIMIHNTLIIIH